MSNKVAASMTASIIIDKKEVISSALAAYASAQKEIEGNKIELLVDVSDDEALKRLKEIQKELSGKDYIIKFKNQGIDETLKSLDELYEKIKAIISGKNLGNGKGIGNFIVDEKTLENVLNTFTDIEKHLSALKRTISDVGDGEEFSPLLKMINNVKNSIDSLVAITGKGSTFNMNIDVGSNTELEAKVQSKISNALQAYQRLFEHIKLSNPADSIITNKFFEFDINQYDTMMGKLQAYKKFIDNMRKEAKSRFNGKDVLFQYTDKSYWSSASAAMAQVTKAFNEMNDSSDKSQLGELFGKTDLTDVIKQLELIAEDLGKISSVATEFKNSFQNGFNVTASVEEIEKLTNKVKELESELDKLKTSSATSVETNISSENLTKTLNQSDRLINDIGKTYDDLLRKIILENNSIKEGNEFLGERIALIKDNIIIDAYQGTRKHVDENFDNQNGNKIIHTHSEDISGENLSASDMDSFVRSYINNKVTEFELIWKNQILNIKLPEGMNEQDLFHLANSYRGLYNSVVAQLGRGLDTVPDEVGVVFGKYINSFLNNILENIGGSLTISQVDTSGIINQIELPKINKEEYESIYSTLIRIKDVDFSGDFSQQIKEILNVTRPLVETIDTLRNSLSYLYNLTDKSNISTNIKHIMPFLADEDVFDLSKILSEQLTENDLTNLSEDVYKQLYIPFKKSREEALSVIEIIRQIGKIDVASRPIKDTFQGDAETEEMKKVAAATDEAVQEKKEFATTNESVQDSVDDSKSKLELEANLMKSIAENSEKASAAKNEFVKANKKVKDSADTSADSIEKETSALDEKEWDKNVKAIQEYMDANTELNNLKAKDKGTGKNAKEIEYQTKKVEELEKVAFEARATLSSMINPHEVPIDDWNKWLEAMKKFDQAAVGSAKSIAKLEDALRNMAESQVGKVDSTLFNSERYLEMLKPSLGNRSVEFENAITEYTKAVKALKDFRSTLDSSIPMTKEQSDKFEELEYNVKKTRIEIDKIPKSLRGSDIDSRMKEIDKLTKYLEENTRISKKAERQLRDYLKLLESDNPNISVKKIHTEWTKVAVEERKAGREGKAFFDLLRDKTIGNRAAQLVSYYLSLTDIIRYVSEGIRSIRELDTAMTEMRKVSDETVNSLKEYQNVSFDLANDVGTTAQQIQNSTADWMRLGRS